LCRGEQRASREVGRGDEPHLLFPAVAAEPEGMQEGEGGKILRAELPGPSAETLEENVKRRPVVEAVDPVRAAAGHEHRLAGRTPAMLHADPERAGGSDAG